MLLHRGAFARVDKPTFACSVSLAMLYLQQLSDEMRLSRRCYEVLCGVDYRSMRMGFIF